MWSFVQNKNEKYWIWLALDVETHEIIGAYVGARDEQAAQKLWESLPPVYRQCAVAYTDYFDKLSTSFGRLIAVFFLANVIMLSVKKQD